MNTARAPGSRRPLQQAKQLEQQIRKLTVTTFTVAIYTES